MSGRRSSPRGRHVGLRGNRRRPDGGHDCHCRGSGGGRLSLLFDHRRHACRPVHDQFGDGRPQLRGRARFRGAARRIEQFLFRHRDRQRRRAEQLPVRAGGGPQRQRGRDHHLRRGGVGRRERHGRDDGDRRGSGRRFGELRHFRGRGRGPVRRSTPRPGRCASSPPRTSSRRRTRTATMSTMSQVSASDGRCRIRGRSQ